MKALIFGSAGQVGRALVATAPAGVELVALDRGGCDIRDRAAIATCIRDARPDVVLNAAAYTAVDRAETERDEADLLNAQAPGWMAQACTAAGARLVHISTDYVFDGAACRPWRPDDPTAPLNVYGATKRGGELAVLAAAPGALVVRTSWIHAAAGANFVHTMLRLMREREAVGVVSDQVGTPTYAPSLAAALWRLADSGARGVHHYTDAGIASWYDLAVAVQEEAAVLGLLEATAAVRPIATSEFPTPARRPAWSVLDKNETWAALGGPAPHWRVNLRACLREIAAYG